MKIDVYESGACRLEDPITVMVKEIILVTRQLGRNAVVVCPDSDRAGQIKTTIFNEVRYNDVRDVGLSHIKLRNVGIEQSSTVFFNGLDWNPAGDYPAEYEESALFFYEVPWTEVFRILNAVEEKEGIPKGDYVYITNSVWSKGGDNMVSGTTVI